MHHHVRLPACLSGLGVLFREGTSDLRDVFLFVDHYRALEWNDRFPILVVADCPHRYYPDVRARARLPLLEHLGARVDSVPLEDRRRQPHLVPAQVGEDVLGDIGDALPRDQRQREGRVHKRSAELRLGRIGMIHVDRSRVLGEEREPHVVGGRHGTPQWVFVDVPHLEVLEEATPPTLLRRHTSHLPLEGSLRGPRSTRRSGATIPQSYRQTYTDAARSSCARATPLVPTPPAYRAAAKSEPSAMTRGRSRRRR